MRRSSEQEPSRVKHRDSFGFVLWISGVFAVGSQVFLHHTHGRQWPGMRGVYGLLAILFFTVFFPNQDVTPLLDFLVAYIAACAVGRINVVARGGDALVHSQYNGRPRIMWLLRFLREGTIKRLVEPLLVLVVGIVTLNLSRPLGAYLVLSGWGLFISTNAPEMYMRRRVEELYDAMSEQQEISERLRQHLDKRR
jgi:hypothetical protein